MNRFQAPIRVIVVLLALGGIIWDFSWTSNRWDSLSDPKHYNADTTFDITNLDENEAFTVSIPSTISTVSNKQVLITGPDATTLTSQKTELPFAWNYKRGEDKWSDYEVIKAPIAPGKWKITRGSAEIQITADQTQDIYIYYSPTGKQFLAIVALLSILAVIIAIWAIVVWWDRFLAFMKS